MEKKKELLGCKVRDIVTGFKGIADSKHIYLNGCVRYYVKPVMKKKEREMPKGATVDIEQLEFIDNGINDKLNAKPSGGGNRFVPDRD
jgi:hypothetical protein